ncbi:MAG: heme-binding protein [Adhaeribacter sp.]|nr:heme-binding protein [Adhaeribacter sp.]
MNSMNRNKSPLIVLFTLAVSIFFVNSCRNVKDAKTANEQELAAGAKMFQSTDPRVQKLKLPAGFQAEHLYSPSENKQGSWVAMTFDDKGRMIVSDQYGFLYRLQVPPVGSAAAKPTVERLNIGPDAPGNDPAKPKIGMGYAQGLLYAFNSLYVMVNHRGNEEFSKTSGLYRLEDANGDDQYEKVTLIKELKGEGEHGPHSIRLSPDKKSLYVVAGNFTDPPQMNAYRLPKVWGEDNLIPLITDPRGHANDRRAPAGWIAKIDPTGTNWEMIGGGLRNTYDIDFNDEGELFAYDSDMEWDFGMPWYKPTRILHVTSGSEFGWRTGNSSWSPTFADNLPPAVNIGQGSPTNFMYGQSARFPDKYRRAFFAFDWSFGIIYAIHLKPEGSSYTADAEEFISGAPLPLTDGVIGPDGAMYFLTGGRRLESDLYRVTYGNNTLSNGKLATVKVSDEVKKARKIRKDLEQYHNTPSKEGGVAFAWPYLKHEDRFIRYAARIAVEHQPVSQWQDRVLQEKDPIALTQAAIALARHGNQSVKNQLLTALTTIKYDQLSDTQKSDLLRAFELVIVRMGMPDAAVKSQIGSYLDAHYPAQSNDLNRGLSKILVHIGAPRAVEKTMALMATAQDDQASKEMYTASPGLILRNPQYGLDIANMLAKAPPAQQMFYATVLGGAKTGWTPALYEKYFTWIRNAFNYKGGLSYIGFINKSRQMALATVPPEKLAEYKTLSGEGLLSSNGNDLANNAPNPKGPGRPWTMEAALPLVESGLSNRNFENGKAMFAATRCISCHNMRGEGGNVGPDLTQLGTRFSSKDMLESIIHPSKVISDQYAATIYTLKDGSSVLGRQISEENDKYMVSQNPFAPDQLREILKKDVVSSKVSNVSIMMPGMINRLNEEELKDLMAYLMSGGNKGHKMYIAQNTSK